MLCIVVIFRVIVNLIVLPELFDAAVDFMQ